MSVQLGADPDIGSRDLEIQFLLEDEALCSHYGWTLKELDEQDAYKIECFKAIIQGQARREEKVRNTQEFKRKFKR